MGMGTAESTLDFIPGSHAAIITVQKLFVHISISLYSEIFNYTAK